MAVSNETAKLQCLKIWWQLNYNYRCVTCLNYTADRLISEVCKLPLALKKQFADAQMLQWKYKQWIFYRVTHGKVTYFELVVLRTASKKNELCQCVVSTRWCHSAQCKPVNDHCSKHVSRAPHFPFRRCTVASSLSRSFVWFFPLGVFEIACLHSQTPYVEWLEGSHISGNSSDRLSVVGPCHGQF